MKADEVIEWLPKQPTAYQLTIYSKTFPTKKNSKQAVFRKGRTMILSSPEYSAWEKMASITVLAWMQEQKVKHKAKFPLEHAALSVIFYFPDSRRRDLSNCVEGLNDVLVSRQVIKDDCWSVLNPISVKGRISKSKPRIEVRLSQPEPDTYER
jgi:Holliday junction resolvase RusA-like endonuclease